MAITTTTTNMSLVLPTPGQQLGPTWATNLNTAFNLIDEHDHTSGKGKKIGVAALTIDADVDFKPSTTAYPVANLSYLTFTNQSTLYAATLNFRLFSGLVDGDLYWNDGADRQIQITSGGGVNASGVQANRFAERTTEVTGTYTILEADDKSVYLSNSGTAYAITLPAADSTAGRFYIIKDISSTASTANITVTASGTNSIDGAATYVIASNYGSATFINRGNSINWDVI
jgi:hypothetical protein